MKAHKQWLWLWMFGCDVALVTTTSGGYYRFDGLAAGDYVVEVAASNFTGAGVLVGCTSSTRDAGDPDTDVDDSDDNGLGTAFSPTNGIRSGVFTRQDPRRLHLRRLHLSAHEADDRRVQSVSHVGRACLLRLHALSRRT